MINNDHTQLMPRPVWRNPRVNLLDDTWLAMIVAILVATVLPWITTGFDVDVGMASWGLLVLGGIHLAFVALGFPTRVIGKWSNRILTLLSLGGVAAIGFIWQHVGALRNPMFLMVFTLPVVSSIFLSRWHPYLLAAASVVVATAVALGQSPELRWYTAGIFGSEAWLTWLFGHQNTTSQATFMGFFAPSSYAVLLEVFAVLTFACAFAAEYLGSLFERLNAHSLRAVAEAERADALWTQLVERLPMPALLVDPESVRIVAASERAAVYLETAPLPLEGRKLFDAVKFAFPDVIQEHLVGADGEVARSLLHLANQVRMARVRITHVSHKGQRLALLTLDDMTEFFCLRTALDTSEYAALVIDARSALMAFNKQAVALFGNLEVGLSAASLVPPSEAALSWWDPGLAGRRKLHLEIGARVFQVSSSGVTLPGAEEQVFSVSLLPVAKAGNADPFATSSTVMMTRSIGPSR
jgi:PAS domain-containing protein